MIENVLEPEIVEEVSIYKQLSRERKALQKEGSVPEWFTTAAYQLFKEKYIRKDCKTIKDVYHRIADKAASYIPEGDKEYWANIFFDMFWKGWLAPSTPVLANMGAGQNCPVSCSGQDILDSIYGFYTAQKETALLSKNGFGTSGYLGRIRERGAPISVGGKASGIVPVFKDFVQLSRDVSQGSTRRGAWAGYVEITHGDFWELCNHILAIPDDANVGWIITDEFINKLNSGDDDAIARYQKALKLKMITGKGYFFFVDKVNRQNPPMYEKHGLKVLASNLCTEITLYSNTDEENEENDETFTCVLSSLNLARYDEWKNTNTIFNALVFLDCVASDFIEIGKNIKGLEAAVRFTEKHRALGLGTLGFHTLLQMRGYPFESMDAHLLNTSLYKEINEETERASQWMAKKFGEPYYCKGFGLRNTHRITVAPNMSSSILAGGVSQGIEPVYKNAYIQATAAGEIKRINPVLLKIMKERNVFNYETVDKIIADGGSVKNVDWLNENEKLVFLTAFEINQHAIIRMASARQRYIDQAQSINLFFSSDVKESVISAVHKEAFEDKYIKSLYYIRSESGVRGSDGKSVCVLCEG